MKKIIPFALVATVLYSCGGSSANKKIMGTWGFDNPDRKDKSITFDKDNKCYSISMYDGKADTVMSGTYSFINSDKKLVTTDGRRNDTVDIIDLTDALLKIKTPDGDTVLMKKK